MPQFVFEEAKKTQVKARVGMAGPAGAGKTYTMLVLLTALAGPTGRIAVIDTERGSSKLYADKFKFSVLTLSPDIDGAFSPKNFTAAIHSAEKAGFDAIGIDGLSPAWEGEGGALDLVDKAAAKIHGNSYVAWRNVTPMHRELVDAMLQSPAHIVATIRSKMDYDQVEEGGRKVIKKLGLAPIQRQGMEYEFTLFCDMDVDHRIVVSKSRCDLMADQTAHKPDAEFWEPFVKWLDDGEEAPPPAPKAEKTTVQTPDTSDYNFAALLTWANTELGLTEADARQILRDGGFTKYTPGVHEQFQAYIRQVHANGSEPVPA
jgi:hypothetical protein